MMIMIMLQPNGPVNVCQETSTCKLRQWHEKTLKGSKFTHPPYTYSPNGRISPTYYNGHVTRHPPVPFDLYLTVQVRRFLSPVGCRPPFFTLSSSYSFFLRMLLNQIIRRPSKTRVMMETAIGVVELALE